MKRERILYTAVVTAAQAELVKRISAKYGCGDEDHAIVDKKNLPAPLFAHELDLQPLWSVRFEEVMRQFDWDYAVDDTILKMVEPHARQCMRTFCRRPELGWNLNVLEREYVLGVEFFYAYLTRYSIERVVFFATPHMGFDHLLYRMCEAMGIPTVLYISSVLDGRAYLIEKIESPVESFLARYRQLQQDYADTPAEAIVMAEDYAAVFDRLSKPQGDKTPPWATKHRVQEARIEMETNWLAAVEASVAREWKQKGPAALSPRFFKRTLLALQWELIRLDLRLTHGAVTDRLLYLSSKHWRQNAALRKAYEKRAVPADLTRKYVYFPLHFQPENTSNPQGGGCYYEQAIPIRILAESLPQDVYVYVKEHPMQASGERTEAFYDELRMIPNVVLVAWETDTYALTQNALAIASLTGTAMQEGLFYNKPAIMFGYWVLQHFPGVYHVRTRAQCRAAVDEILKGPAQIPLKDLKLAYKAMADTEAEGVHNADFAHDTQADTLRRAESCMKLYDDYMQRCAQEKGDF